MNYSTVVVQSDYNIGAILYNSNIYCLDLSDYKMHFYLQFLIKDTKSLNGTFVNKDRLSTSRKESLPRELRTNDLVQFGNGKSHCT